MNVELKSPIYHFRFILVQKFFMCARYNGSSFVCCFFLLSLSSRSSRSFDFLCQYNGFVVIMNSNHVFYIKARPMKQLKFIGTNTRTTTWTKIQASKWRARYFLMHTHTHTHFESFRLDLLVHFHCNPHFPLIFRCFFVFIDWFY